jgi:hypothetical protein
MMKLTTAALCLAAAGTVGLAAQTGQTTTKTKVEVKDGKSVEVTGCVEVNPEGGFMLTHVADKKGTMHRYVLVSDDKDFAKHVGHRMTIEGTAADRGHGKVETDSKTKTDGQDKAVRTKTEASGDLLDMNYLGVKSMKMIAASCP